MDDLTSLTRARDIKTALQNPPSGLENTYSKCIERIDNDARRLLRWMVLSIRPLSFREMEHAISVEPGDTNIEEEDLFLATDIVSRCAGLVIIDARGK